MGRPDYGVSRKMIIGPPVYAKCLALESNKAHGVASHNLMLVGNLGESKMGQILVMLQFRGRQI